MICLIVFNKLVEAVLVQNAYMSLVVQTRFGTANLFSIWFLLTGIFAQGLSAQVPTFQSGLTVSTPVCPGANAFAPVAGISISSLSRGPGIGCINHTSPLGTNADSWATGATLNLSNNDYFEFTVTGSGCSSRLDSLRLWLRKSMSDPPQKVAIYYVLNNGTPQAVGTAIDLTGFGNATLFSLLINLTSTPALSASDQLSIRLYGWQANTTSGTLRWVSQPGNVTTLYGSFPALSAGSVSADQTICPGNSGTLNLTSYNGLIQRWEYANPPYAGWNVIGNTTSSQAYSNLSQDTRYRALVSCGANIDTAVYAQLTWGLASAVLSGDHTICTGPAADLTVQMDGIPPWNLTWSDGINSFTQNGISSSPWIISVNPIQSTTYSLVQVVNICGNGSPLIGNPRVVKGYTHNATLSGSQNLCGGSGTANLSFTFTGFPPWDIQYSDGTSIYSIVGITASPRLVPLTLTSNITYSILSSYSGVCPGSVSGSASYNLYPIPTAQISAPQILCRPNPLQLSFQLTGTPPWSLTWTDGTVQYSMQGILSSPMVMNVANPASSVYSILTVRDTFCIGMGGSSSSVFVADPPTANISGNGTICQGQLSQAIVSLTGMPPWNISWSDGTSNQSVSGITNANYVLTLSPQASSTFQLLSVSDIQCGAGSTNGLAEYQVLLPVSASLWGDTTFCKGGLGNISVGFTGQSPWHFTLLENGVPQIFSGVFQNPWVQQVSPLTTTEYILSQAGNICGDQNMQDTIHVTINEVPDWTFSGPDWLCKGDEAEITLNFSGTGPWTYYYSRNDTVDSLSGITVSPFLWSFLPNDSIVDLQLGGVKNLNCFNSRKDSLSFPVYPKPTPAFTSKDSILVVLFSPTMTLFDSLRWELGDGTETLDSFPVHEYPASGNYLVGLIMHLGKCTARFDSTILVRKPFMDFVVVYENPNNGDFSFSVNYLNNGDKAEISLFTREGRVIYEETAKAEGSRIWREVRLKGEISPGLYILRVINKHGIFRTKIIIGS